MGHISSGRASEGPNATRFSEIVKIRAIKIYLTKSTMTPSCFYFNLQNTFIYNFTYINETNAAGYSFKQVFFKSGIIFVVDTLMIACTFAFDSTLLFLTCFD